MSVLKEAIIEELQCWVKDSEFVFVVDYKGMTVDEFNEIRNRLHEVNSVMHVVKNNLLRRAFKNEEQPEEVDEHLAGQTAIVFGEGDVSAVAKVLKNFAAEFEKPGLKCGIFEGSLLDPAGVKAIADLPSREVLLGKILGVINAPASRLARLINTPGGQVAQVIKAKSEKGE